MASDRPFVVYADGDPIGATPATMRVRPRCLRVVVPGADVPRSLEALARAAAGRQPPPRPQRRHHRARAAAAAPRPGALERMAGRLDRGAVLVSATNGKTTTSAMVAAILERRRPAGGAQPRRLEHGLGRGHRAAGRGHASRGQIGLFEVDEAWLPQVAEALRPQPYLLSNLFRDQLDRYGELELLADRWAELVARAPTRAAPASC